MPSVVRSVSLCFAEDWSRLIPVANALDPFAPRFTKRAVAGHTGRLQPVFKPAAVARC